MKTEQEVEGIDNRRMDFFVRQMRPGDIVQVARVERECFPTGWTPTPFPRELQNKRARYLVACQAKDPNRAGEEARRAVFVGQPQRVKPLLSRLVARIKGVFVEEPLPPSDFSYYIAGYLGVWFMMDEVHITAIGTGEADRRKGIGELLLIACIEVGLRQGSRVVTLETRVSNHPAQALYYKYGFSRAGIRKGYYSDNREDALVMTTDDLTSMPFRQQFEQLRGEHAQRWGESVRHLG